MKRAFQKFKYLTHSDDYPNFFQLPAALNVKFGQRRVSKRVQAILDNQQLVNILRMSPTLNDVCRSHNHESILLKTNHVLTLHLHVYKIRKIKFYTLYMVVHCGSLFGRFGLSRYTVQSCQDLTGACHTILQDLFKILKDPTKFWQDLVKILKDHAKILQDPAKIWQCLGKILQDHAKILQDLAKI